MSMRDKIIYTEFLKYDFRLKGVKSSQPSNCMIDEYNSLVENKKKQQGVKKRYPEAEGSEMTTNIKSSAVIASKLGVSSKVIENCRYIFDHASEDIIKRVIAGELSISQAVALAKPYREYKKRQTKGIGRPRKKPEVSMVVIFTDTFEDLLRNAPQAKNRVSWAFELLCRNLVREGWVSKEESEDIKRVLNQ